jgi:hypothetical protein
MKGAQVGSEVALIEEGRAMQTIRWSLVGAVLALALGLVSTAPSVLADPINGTHKEVFPITCSGETFQVVGGRGAPAQVVDSQEVFVPASFVQVSSWTDPVTNEIVTQTDAFSVGQGKRTGQQDDQITCTYTATFEDPVVGPVHVDGSVTGFFAPRG